MLERPYRGLLRMHRTLARFERPGDRGVDEWVLQQLLRKLAERVLALAGNPVAQPARGVLVGHGVLLGMFLVHHRGETSAHEASISLRYAARRAAVHWAGRIVGGNPGGYLPI